MNRSKERGITIIGLIITVLVLGILSFITVRFLLRDKMIDKANEASEKIQEASNNNFTNLRKHYTPQENSSEIWVTYCFEDESFNGTNYLNTGIRLFSSSNLHRDFEISATVSNFQFLSGQADNRNVIICNQYEGGDPYQGFGLQHRDGALKIQINVTKRGDYSANWGKSSGKIIFKRIEDKFYQDDNDTALVDFGNKMVAFNAPLTFGANIDASEKPRRFCKADVSDIAVKLKYNIDEMASLYQNLPVPEKNSMFFDGWYTAPEGRYKNNINFNSNKIR